MAARDDDDDDDDDNACRRGCVQHATHRAERDDDEDDDEDDDDDIIGTCRVCLDQVSRADINRAAATMLGCACTHACAHIACGDAYVRAKAHERRAKCARMCEVCHEDMVALPTPRALARRVSTSTTTAMAADAAEGERQNTIVVVDADDFDDDDDGGGSGATRTSHQSRGRVRDRRRSTARVRDTFASPCVAIFDACRCVYASRVIIAFIVCFLALLAVVFNVSFLGDVY